MQYKYIDSNGKEQHVSDLAAFALLRQAGEITDDTLIYDVERATWCRLRDVDLSHVHPIVSDQSQLETMERTSAEPLPPPASPSGRTGHTHLFISAAIFVVAFTALVGTASLYYPDNVVEGVTFKLAYILGFYFWIPIVAFFVWRGGGKRKGVFAMTFAILFLAAAGYESYKMYDEVRLAKSAVRELRDLMGNAAARVDIAPKQYTKQQYQQLAPLLQFANDLAVESQKINQQMEVEIDQIGMPELFSREVLGTKQSMGRAQTKLIKIRKVLESHKASAVERFNDMRRQAQNLSLDLDDTAKRAFLGGFNESDAVAEPLTMRYFDIQIEIVNTGYEMLEYVKRHRYTFKGDGLLFRTQAETDRYNQYRDRIMELALEESDLVETAQTRMGGVLSKFDREIGRKP